MITFHRPKGAGSGQQGRENGGQKRQHEQAGAQSRKTTRGGGHENPPANGAPSSPEGMKKKFQFCDTRPDCTKFS
jgi:hypothetical protein